MKRISVLILVAMLIGIVMIIFHRGKPKPGTAEPQMTERDSNLKGFSEGGKSARPPLENTNLVSLSPRATPHAARVREDPLSDWKTPIDFYGKVIDENGEAIPGASIHFIWNDLSAEGTSKAETRSSAQGLFALKGERGKRLYVKVEKVGYYTSKRDETSFEYANELESIFNVPNPAQPVIFHLRRKGNAEPLVHGLKLFGFAIDGSPSYVDLLQSKKSASLPADLIVRFSRSEPNQERRYDWSLTLEVPDGGLIESTNEFMFQAPAEGYQHMIEIVKKSDSNDWLPEVKRQFFLRSRGGRAYARIEATIIPYYQLGAVMDLDYYINTNASRNLEFDPNVQAKQAVYE